MYLSVCVIVQYFHQRLRVFSEQRLFASSGRFMPGFFFFFDVMANRIVSLISLSLLVYKNARDFCVLILYPATLPDSLMILVVFW